MKASPCYFLLVAGIFFASCNQPTPADQAVLKSKIGEVNQQWMAAFEKGSASEVAAFYTKESQLLPPNAPVFKGREGVVAFMDGMLKGGVRKIKITTSEIEGDEKRALETGTFQVMIDGDRVVDKGKYVVEWKNLDGKWYFHREMFNSDLPSPRVAARQDEQVWVVIYPVKADKRQAFEEFVRKQLYASIDRSKPTLDKLARQTRLVIPTEAEEDGSYRYMFIMDPVIEGESYAIEDFLISKHGEEKAKEMMKEFDATLAGPYDVIEGKQSEI